MPDCVATWRCKKFDDTFSRFDRIRTCDRQTDGQTDILARHSPRYAYASRCKNTKRKKHSNKKIKKTTDELMSKDFYGD